ncbi:hypothetical protein ACNF49_41145 [Actinomadura sp. ATCC 39365]
MTIFRNAFGQHGMEVPFAEGQQSVGALSACGAGPSLGERIARGIRGGIFST